MGSNFDTTRDWVAIELIPPSDERTPLQFLDDICSRKALP